MIRHVQHYHMNRLKPCGHGTIAPTVTPFLACAILASARRAPAPLWQRLEEDTGGCDETGIDPPGRAALEAELPTEFAEDIPHLWREDVQWTSRSVPPEHAQRFRPVKQPAAGRTFDQNEAFSLVLEHVAVANVEVCGEQRPQLARRELVGQSSRLDIEVYN
jgi:hypothetical protein